MGEESRYEQNVSDELLDVIRANECESSVGSLCTDRFRRFWNEIVDLRTALQSSEARAERLERERDELALAICGGEDAPGYAASLDQAALLGVLADNHASARRDGELAWDGETATSWKARALDAERRLAVAGELLDETDTFLSALANHDDENDEWDGRDLFRDFRAGAGELLERQYGSRQALSLLGEGTNGDS